MYRKQLLESNLLSVFSVVVDAMLKLLFVGVLFQVIRCQTLYKSVFINDSFLYDGKEKELNILLDGCENKLREESIKTKEGIRREKELKSKLEASEIAVMALHGHYFQGKT